MGTGSNTNLASVWPSRVLWLLVVISLGVAVVLLYTNEQHDRLDSDARIVGRVLPPFAADAELRVALYREHRTGPRIDAIATAGKDGVFAFIARAVPDERGLWVFNDLNANGRYDADEPEWHGSLSALSDASDSRNEERTLTVRLSASPRDATLLASLDQQYANVDTDAIDAAAIPIGFGEVVSLDDPRLASNTGVRGLWRPAKAVRETGLGVYFIEPYDEQRTPMVLVHGAGGSAQDFRALIQQLDPTRWQFWFYAYPSGIRLDRAAQALGRILVALHHRYETAPVAIVAHSMGGLVARATVATLEHHENPGVVGALVTVSTPWRGHPAARIGVKRSPVTLPSWHDMLPDSPFIKAIVSQPIATPHLIVYGEKSREKFYLPKRNDGTIGVDSATFAPIVADADDVRRYELGHTEIIRSNVVSASIENFLSSLYDE